MSAGRRICSAGVLSWSFRVIFQEAELGKRSKTIPESKRDSQKGSSSLNCGPKFENEGCVIYFLCNELIMLLTSLQEFENKK